MTKAVSGHRRNKQVIFEKKDIWLHNITFFVATDIVHKVNMKNKKFEYRAICNEDGK